MLQIRPDIPIILCTGYSSIINEEQAHHYGIEGFVTRPIIKKELKIEAKSEIPTATQIKEVSSNKEVGVNSEMLFLTSLRERLLVLFEGFQAPNNTNIEAKIDLTLNFLEYVLVTIDTRVEELERGEGK